MAGEADLPDADSVALHNFHRVVGGVSAKKDYRLLIPIGHIGQRCHNPGQTDCAGGLMAKTFTMPAPKIDPQQSLEYRRLVFELLKAFRKIDPTIISCALRSTKQRGSLKPFACSEICPSCKIFACRLARLGD